MKRINLIAIAAILLLSSCQRSCAKLQKQNQTSDREYTVTMYSGGKPVFVDHFNGIINDSENSDGCYYFKGDTLIEISGDYLIKSDK